MENRRNKLRSLRIISGNSEQRKPAPNCQHVIIVFRMCINVKIFKRTGKWTIGESPQQKWDSYCKDVLKILMLM